MSTTAGRLLALLGLLQSRPEWPGAELAARLDVTGRTVRNDVARLRDLGYPVDAVRGPGGRYRLGVGGKLPPLVLDDDEAVAIAVGLRSAGAVAGIEESSVRALGKLEHVLPDRLRRQVAALRDATSAGPLNTDSNVEDPAVDPALLTDLAAAIRDHQACAAGTARSRGRWSRPGSSPGSAAGTSWAATSARVGGSRSAWTGWSCGPRADGGSRPGISPST